MKEFDDEINKAFNKKIKNNRNKKYIIVISCLAIIVLIVVWTFILHGDKTNNLTTTEVTSEQTEDVATPMEVSTPQEPQVTTTSEPEEIDILEELGIEIPEKDLNFDELHQENEHIYAWIYIPGTLVDYPVLQHPTDNAFYLEHNIDGSAGYPGCIYTELYNKKDFSDRNTLVYGHNMANGTMFASLHYFENSQNFEENQYIYIYMEDKVYVYHIFAAYAFPGIHLMKHFDYTDDKVYEEYLNDIFSGNYYGFIREGVEVTIDNKIITLSTCIAGQPDMRYLVQGVLLNEEK